MLVLPVYDLLLLPGVTFYFKKDILDRMQVEKVEKGEEILFLIQKSEKRREDLTVDDFQNKGLVGTVENIDDDGNLSIRIHDRVEISDVELQNGEFMADGTVCQRFSVGRLGTGFHTALEYDDGDCVCDFRVSESVSRRKI